MNSYPPVIYLNLWLILLIVFILPESVLSQRVEEKVLTRYTQADNLSSYNIRKIAQDKYGFTWIATQDGLNRFDGNQFNSYKKNASGKNALLGVDIRDIIIDSSNNLVWVLSGEGGLNAINNITGNVVRTVAMRSNDSEDWNLSMTMVDGNIWIGSFKGVQTYDIRSNRLEPAAILDLDQNKKRPFETREILSDGYGNVWACVTEYGIVIYNGKDRSIIKTIPGAAISPGAPFKCLGSLTFADGSVLLATSSGLRKIVFDRQYNYTIETSPCKSLAGINSSLIYSVNTNVFGEIVITTSENILVFDKNLDRYTVLKQIRKEGESDWFNTVFCTYSDSSGNMWLGCNEGVGFLKYRPDAFTPVSYNDRSNLKLEHVHSLYPLGNGDVLAGLKNGLVYFDHEKLSLRQIDTANLYHHIYEDPNKIIHAIRTNGMFIYKNHRLLPVSAEYSELRPVSTFPVNSHLNLGDSIVILGTENDRGIIVWNIRKKLVYTIDATTWPVALAANIVNALYQDSRGKIWILSDKAITILDKDLQSGKTLQYLDSNSKQPLNIYFDMCEAAGFYWIATYGTGILQLDSNLNLVRIVSSRNGLSNDGVYKIFCHDGKRLFITSNNGVSIFNVENYSFSNVYERDGLHNNAFEEASGYMTKGIIYAGGLNGFTIINPANFFTNAISPRLFINRVEIVTNTGQDDSSNLFMQKISIPNTALQTRVYFSALNYTNPSRTTFSYKINEFHKEWISNGTQSFVNLFGLHPGTYTLEVKAANEDGVWSEPIQLTLTFLPKWYQTWWFKVLMALTTATIAYGFYRMRIIQLKKEAAMRKKIAGDLHDDLGSTLNSIKIYTNLALMKPGNQGYLEHLREGVQNAIVGVRDMVWILDDKQDSVRHLVERIDQFADPLATANNARFEKSVHHSVQELILSKKEKRNLFLIIKEAVNNSIKYASANVISLNIGLNQRSKLFVEITDDGKGFDVNREKKGYGLENISLRADQIRYQLQIDTSNGNGTRIRLVKI